MKIEVDKIPYKFFDWIANQVYGKIPKDLNELRKKDWLESEERSDLESIGSLAPCEVDIKKKYGLEKLDE